MQIKMVELDGKRIAYCDETEFFVQVGRGRSAYKTRYVFKGNFHQAFLCYRGVNVGNGYKKRLLMPSCSVNPVIARQFSF